MNSITVEGEYKFAMNSMVEWFVDDESRGKWQVMHRYTERFERNQVAAIARYVIWDADTGRKITVSEIVLR